MLQSEPGRCRSAVAAAAVCCWQFDCGTERERLCACVCVRADFNVIVWHCMYAMHATSLRCLAMWWHVESYIAVERNKILRLIRRITSVYRLHQRFVIFFFILSSALFYSLCAHCFALLCFGLLCALAATAGDSSGVAALECMRVAWQCFACIWPFHVTLVCPSVTSMNEWASKQPLVEARADLILVGSFVIRSFRLFRIK